MNHDYAHCINCRPDCPRGCFRAQLTWDLQYATKPYTVAWACFKGTEECPRRGRIEKEHGAKWESKEE